MSEEKVFIRQEWVYAGRRLDKKGDLFDAFHPIKEDGTLADEGHLYNAKGSGRRLIGGVYAVEATEGGTTARVKNAQYVRDWRGDEAAGWRLESDAAEAVKKLKSAEAKGKRDMPELRCLDPLRAVYKNTISFTDRAAMELLVIMYLRRP